MSGSLQALLLNSVSAGVLANYLSVAGGGGGGYGDGQGGGGGAGG